MLLTKTRVISQVCDVKLSYMSIDILAWVQSYQIKTGLEFSIVAVFYKRHFGESDRDSSCKDQIKKKLT